MLDRFSAVAVTCALSSFLVLGFRPVDEDPPTEPPPANACECPADSAAETYDCPGAVMESATVTPLEVGNCAVPPCDPQACRFQYSLSVTWEESVDRWVVLNGEVRAHGHGLVTTVNPAPVSVACGNQQIIAVGTGTQPCAEVMVACWNCHGAGQ